MNKQLNDFVKGAIYGCFKNDFFLSQTITFIEKAYGDRCATYQQVNWWFREFHAERDVLIRKEGSGRPTSVTKGDTTDLVLNAIEDNPFLTLREMEDMFDVPRETIRLLLLENNRTKVSTRWVPHRLNDRQKLERIEAAKENLRNIKNGKLDPLKLITCDEKQFHMYIPYEHKHSQVWHEKGASKVAIPKPSRSTS